MKTVISVLLFSFFAGNFLRAQTDSSATTIEFMYVGLGPNLSTSGYTDAERMRKLAKDPEGALLNENLNPYFKGVNGYTGNAYPDLAVGVGIRLWNKTKGVFRKATLRLSLRYSGFSPLNTWYGVDSTTYAGTYYNTNTSLQPIVINEVKHSSYSINYHVNVMQLEAAQYFHTKETRRVSVYGGYAVMLGASVFSRLEVSKGYSTRYEQQSSSVQNGSVFFHKLIDSEYEYERYKANGAFTAGAGLPMGIQLRLSKKNNAFGRLTYALEFQPRLNTFLVKGSNALLTPGASVTSVLKCRL